ncbi:pentapeptide repeat-containing protein [Amycolatopsis sp. BJA-103]|uniref:pentapeptide repeat-containing protein n=1 Tax=Amycolatopsis sp. BJA-103 TaxID=1911175 RepID=UPI000C7694BC
MSSNALPRTTKPNARRSPTIFDGHAAFNGATFTSDAIFAKTTFAGDAGFRKATFAGDAWFGGATVKGKPVAPSDFVFGTREDSG